MNFVNIIIQMHVNIYHLLLFESFIKIGITTKSIKERFSGCPYKFEIIKIIEGDSGYIFDFEIRTKKLFKSYKYIPLCSFKGETECYKLN